MAECKYCNDEPYEVGYVDVGIGSVPAYINWECKYCYEVLKSKQWSRRKANMMIYWHKIQSIPYKIKSLYWRFKYRNNPLWEEEEIPF